MKKNASTKLGIVLAGVLALSGATASADFTLSTVTIGNPGNANDAATGGIYGQVNYTYNIGTYDVTLTQYTAFLNAVAQTDTYGLYNASMASSGNYSGNPTGAGILQTGVNGSYSYSVIGSSGNNPVTFVSWYDAARFANWLSNGQPLGLQTTGTTETGAYTLTGNTGTITNNGSGTYWIPTENEWYKAAYYDPNKGGPGVGGYWTYATKSNTPPENIVGSGANMANYYTDQGSGVYSVTQSGSLSNTQNYLTDVGAFTGSASAYGTYDQSGDVYNWNDEVILGSSRGLRGGAWNGTSSAIQSSNRNYDPQTAHYYDTGFRIATTVPEPTTSVSLIFAGGLLLSRRKRPSAL